MTRFDELDEQAEEQWHSRVAQERLDLSASVEESMSDGSIQEEQESEEADNPALLLEGTILIPPRLSLQSKPLPAVRPDTASEPVKSPAPPGDVEAGTITTENTNIFTRFAQHLTSSLASFGGKVQPAMPAPQTGMQSSAKVEGVSAAQPARYVGPAVRVERSQAQVAAKLPPAHSTQAIAAPARNKQGLTRRTTKVRLQVVPKTEETHSTEELIIPLSDAATNPRLPAVDEAKKSAGTAVPEQISGSGTFESAQSEVAVANVHVTPSSVVVVMLAGDPGPVVVQYVSLQPKTGFTVHLSAPTKNRTPFNYRIL